MLESLVVSLIGIQLLCPLYLEIVTCGYFLLYLSLLYFTPRAYSTHLDLHLPGIIGYSFLMGATSPFACSHHFHHPHLPRFSPSLCVGVWLWLFFVLYVSYVVSLLRPMHQDSENILCKSSFLKPTPTLSILSHTFPLKTQLLGNS